jgi:hypothetical protein
MMPGGANQNRNARTAARRVAIQTEDRRRMAQLRAAGATFRELGIEFGIDPTTAREHIIRLLDEVNYEAANELRTLEGERLDRLQRGIWADAIAGHVGKIDRVLKIMDQRARLFGLYAPVLVDASFSAAQEADARHTVADRVELIRQRRTAIEAASVDAAIPTNGD